MKKTILFLSLSLFAFSCDGDDDLTPFDPNNAQTAIVKKIVETYDDNSTLTTTFAYNDNKIINFSDSDGDSAIFTYSGDRITRIDYYTGGTVTQTDLITYNSDSQITSYKTSTFEDNLGTKDDFTYNTDGTVSAVSHHGSLTEQDQLGDPYKLFFTDGELVKKITYGNPNTITETYTYDDKNNPFKNVIGLNKVWLIQGEIYGVNKNMTTYSGTDHPRSVEYQYNAADFPTNSEEIGTGAESGIISQYFYE